MTLTVINDQAMKIDTNFANKYHEIRKCVAFHVDT